LIFRINQQIQRNNPKPATKLLEFCKYFLCLILNFHLIHTKRTIRKRPLTFRVTQIRPQNVLRSSNISTQMINFKIFYFSFRSHIKNNQCNAIKLSSFTYFYTFYTKPDNGAFGSKKSTHWKPNCFLQIFSQINYGILYGFCFVSSRHCTVLMMTWM
jgi:hypothetical protein